MKILAACLSLAYATSVTAITIKVDYTYDSNNFFNTPEKRAALEAVASFYGNLLNDNLLEINQAAFGGGVSWEADFTHPGTGAVQSVPGLVVPADTLVIYAGGRSLPGSTVGQGGPGGFSASGTQGWFNRIRGRGNSGTLAPPYTDFAPWGGSVTFDTDATWNFSLTTNAAGNEFVSIALHEIGHVLGVGTSDVWDALTTTDFFIGPAATQSRGASPPALFESGHVQHPVGDTLESPLFRSFQVSHGVERPVLMLPFIIDNGSNFDVATDLDLSLLFDIGWEVFPPSRLDITSLTPANASFQWPSTSFLDYRVERGGDLITFPDGNTLASGDGSVQSWSDPSPPPTRAFYRLFSQYNLAAPSSIFSSPIVQSGPLSPEKHTTFRVDPIMVDCKLHVQGGCGHHHE